MEAEGWSVLTSAGVIRCCPKGKEGCSSPSISTRAAIRGRTEPPSSLPRPPSSPPALTIQPTTPPSSEMAAPPEKEGRVASQSSHSACASLHSPLKIPSEIAISNTPLLRNEKPSSTSGRPGWGMGARGRAVSGSPEGRVGRGEGSLEPSMKERRLRIARSLPEGRWGRAALWPTGGHEIFATSARKTQPPPSPTETASLAVEGSIEVGENSAG